MWSMALEGGGTKGAYHIGVFRALRELGIEIECVVGTSIGAINGAIFASGDTECYKLWDDVTLSNVVALPDGNFKNDNLFDIKNIISIISEIYVNKGLDIAPLEKLLQENIDEDKIRMSNTELGIVTYSVTEKTEKQFFLEDIPKGKLVDYLIASACFPVFRRKNIDNDVFMDGGIKNNMPVDMLLSKKCKDIILVSVGGVGFSKNISGAGCNFVNIKCNEDEVGTLDFDHDGIKKLQGFGYFDTYKAFGYAMGNKYYFDGTDYLKSLLKYGVGILTGLEYAAQYLEIDIFKIYKVESLIQLVINKFESEPVINVRIDFLTWNNKKKLCSLAYAIINNDNDFLSNKLAADLLGPLFQGASAIAYFMKSK